MVDKCTHFQEKKTTGTNFLEHEWTLCPHTGTDRQTYRLKPINLMYPQTSFAGGIINVMYIQPRH